MAVLGCCLTCAPRFYGWHVHTYTSMLTYSHAHILTQVVSPLSVPKGRKSGGSGGSQEARQARLKESEGVAKAKVTVQNQIEIWNHDLSLNPCVPTHDEHIKARK